MLKLAGGIAVTTALTVLLPALSHSPASVRAAQVQAALQQVNTWHLQGWKQLDGAQVPWEVWRRQTPYFYYDRIGGDITMDDGKQRLRLFRADPRLLRSRDILLRTATGPDQKDVNAESFDGEE